MGNMSQAIWLCLLSLCLSGAPSLGSIMPGATSLLPMGRLWRNNSIGRDLVSSDWLSLWWSCWNGGEQTLSVCGLFSSRPHPTSCRAQSAKQLLPTQSLLVSGLQPREGAGAAVLVPAYCRAVQTIILCISSQPDNILR